MALTVQVCDALASIPAIEWDALVDTQSHPFLSHACLEWFESSGAVCPETGWTPAHHLVRDPSGALLAAAPCYLKDHSHGEFVFDFSWANAAHGAGIAYYPKLVCCIPFTPVPGPRLLGHDPQALAALSSALIGACEAQAAPAAHAHGAVSSAHRLFETLPGSDTAAHTAAHTAAQAEAIDDSRWLQRRDVRYIWRNQDYASFDAFLAALSSKRRKEIRRERKRVTDQNLTCAMRDAESLSDADWDAVETCYARTYAVRGQHAYLPPGFWRGLARRLPGTVKVACVTHPDHTGPDHEWSLLAAALFLRGKNTLYGRHWGTLADIDCLHFETCYYQGIDYCIAHGLDVFDAGVQGQQKLRRGFEPVISQSQHYVAHPGLRAAVARALAHEGAAIAEIRDDHAAHTAFKQADPP